MNLFTLPICPRPRNVENRKIPARTGSLWFQTDFELLNLFLRIPGSWEPVYSLFFQPWCPKLKMRRRFFLHHAYVTLSTEFVDMPTSQVHGIQKTPQNDTKFLLSKCPNNSIQTLLFNWPFEVFVSNKGKETLGLFAAVKLKRLIRVDYARASMGKQERLIGCIGRHARYCLEQQVW